MTRNRIVYKVKKIISKEMGGDILPGEYDDLIADLSFDSIDLIELYMRLEEEFKISIYESEIKELNTVKDIIDFLEKEVV